MFRSRLAAHPEEDPQAATGLWARIFGNQSLSWADLGWLRSLTTLPILLKGICSPDDARRAVDAGMDGIYCSNPGGRQANGGLPALDCLADDGCKLLGRTSIQRRSFAAPPLGLLDNWRASWLLARPRRPGACASMRGHGATGW